MKRNNKMGILSSAIKTARKLPKPKPKPKKPITNPTKGGKKPKGYRPEPVKKKESQAAKGRGQAKGKGYLMSKGDTLDVTSVSATGINTGKELLRKMISALAKKEGITSAQFIKKYPNNKYVKIHRKQNKK
jgi:hypothetical protein